MGTRRQTAAEIRENLAERLDWRCAERDDTSVAQALLYELDQMDIIFAVIAKSNMAARTTALALCTEGPIFEHIETVCHGYGRDTWTEQSVTQLKPVTRIRNWTNDCPPKVAEERLQWDDRPIYRILATDTGKLTALPAAVDPAAMHLASAVASQAIDEAGDETTAHKKSDFLAHSLLHSQGTFR